MQYTFPIIAIIISVFFLVFITENASSIPILGFPILVLLFLGIILYSIYSLIQSRPEPKDPTQEYKRWLDHSA